LKALRNGKALCACSTKIRHIAEFLFLFFYPALSLPFSLPPSIPLSHPRPLIFFSIAFTTCGLWVPRRTSSSGREYKSLVSQLPTPLQC
jgi:hypothetical protein